MKVCAVVIWHNPNPEMMENIKTYSSYLNRVYIIDNSMEDNQKLSENLKNVKYIINNNNLGIARALNIGCHLAIEDGYDIALTMDQDSFFEKDEFKDFLQLGVNKFNEDPCLAIVAPSTMNNEEKMYCDRVITSGNLLKLKIYALMKGFKDELFIDEVDHEFCYRLRSKGYKVFKEPSIYMKHQLGNMKRVSFFVFKFYTTNHSYIRRYYMFRNRLIMRRKFPEYTKGYVSSCIKEIIKIILSEDDKARKIKYAIRGIIDYKRGRLGEYRE